ncbi:non-homologous end-joining DNA ligase [Kitasatospora sp. NPDC008050]|uniref:non-homologous end-joining DNA ligase n=1 Tax=Kitasatospora sp. NPDC008050 TaxID=3364021 RepID=UPI0036E66775
MTGLLAGLPPREQRLLRPACADLGTPMLAVSSTPEAAGSFGDGWLFERKLDGIRLLAVRDRQEVHLFSRSGRSLDTGYPEVVTALAAQDCQDFVVDGELVALNGGRTDFSLLQQRMQLTEPAAVRASPVAVSYFLFDLLRLDGSDTGRLPLRSRKALLRAALAFRAPLHYTEHHDPGGHGAPGSRELLDQACARGWEGLVAKRADGPYLHRRSADWQKLKCVGGQEFVIGGFTEPAGGRIGFGALLLGYYEQGRLRYAGKVGTGFDAAALRVLRGGLDTIEQARSPFVDEPAEQRAHWVRPVLIAQVGFSEWTRAGLLRHPRFLGLRDDKRPREVVRESTP